MVKKVKTFFTNQTLCNGAHGSCIDEARGKKRYVMRFVSLEIHQIGEHRLDLFGGTCVRVLVLYQLILGKGVFIKR